MYGVFIKKDEGSYTRIDYAKKKADALEKLSQYRTENPDEAYVAEKLNW